MDSFLFPSFLPFFIHLYYFLQPTSISSFYLEGHPDGVDLCSGPGEGGCPGPDGEQGGLSLDQLHNRLGDGALVLVAGHHKVKHDGRGEAEEAHHGDEGEPVHLPEVGHRRKEKLKEILWDTPGRVPGQRWFQQH